METPIVPRRRPDIAAIIAGVIGIAALIMWIASWLMPSPQEEEAPTAPQSPVVTRADPAPPSVEPAPAPAKPKPETTERIASAKSAAQKSETPPKPQVSVTPADATPKAVAKPVAPKASAAEPVPPALSGRYVGTYSSAAETVGLTLEISGIADGVISATATLGGQACRGRYPMEGTYKGHKLQMRAPRNGGPAGDCPLNFVLALEGERLTGASDSGDRVQLRR